MSTEQNRTGYPYIDKPWLKYYSEEAINAEMPECTMYEYLYENCKDNLNGTAINYFGKKISYHMLLDRIDKTAQAFAKVGVKAGDVVTVITLNIPELVYIIYALNKLGAVACMEYVTQTKEALQDSLKKSGSRIVVILDLFMKDKMEAVLMKSIEKIVVLSVTDSMSFPLKVAAFGKRIAMPSDERIMRYKQFMELAAGEEINEERRDKIPAVMVSTSGSTGVPKKVVLSSRNINSVVWMYQHGGMNFKKNETFLAMAPPFLAFGIVLTLHLPLCLNIVLLLNPDPDPGKNVKLFARIKPNHFLGGTAHIDLIMKNPKIQKMNLSFLKTVATGGDSLTLDKRKRFDEFLICHHAEARHIHGYGMTELAATAITERNDARKEGSLGIPQCRVNVKCVDLDTREELSYNKEGEILVYTPGGMMEYYQNPEETGNTIVLDEEGKAWIRTGDLGTIDEDGFVFLKGRIKRIFQRFIPELKQVFKVFPDYIEEKLESLDIVRRCAVILIEHEEQISVPIAFCQLNTPAEKTENLISSQLKKILPVQDVPVKYIFIEEFPLLSSGKIDYKKLEKMYEEQ